MFHLNSFKLFSSESISKDLSSTDYAKTEKRLKELSTYLGLNNGKQSWPPQLQLTAIASSVGSHHHHHHHHHQHNQPIGPVEKIIALHWNDVYKSFVIVLSNGLIASCFFHPVYLNCITSIYLDRYLMGKIKTEHMVDFIFDHKRIIISYTSSSLICVLLDDVKRNKAWSSKKRKLFKLKSRNVKIVEHELEINCSLRRVERHLLKSEIRTDDEDLLIVWWQNGSNIVCPWSSPITSKKDFCNILIYNLIHDTFDLVGFASILNDILKICFSKQRANRLITIEYEGDPRSILYREYEMNSTGEYYVLDLVESIQLVMPCQCIKADFNFELDKVLLLCEDRSVLMYSVDQNSIRYFQAPINAIDLINSPLDSYFIMADTCGQIMMYDYGLHVMSANYDDLFLREAFSGLCEMKFLDNSLLCLRFTDDPNLMLITLPLNVDYIGLIRTYVKHDYINEAIENLQYLNWNINSYLAYSSLNIILNHLLRQPLNSIKESQLQETLASFYIPKIPISDDIIEEYQYEMHCIAKRFFYHLYRYSCLEKAFLLALDLKSRHLFLLLHKIAKERGNEKLAGVSLQNAHKFNNSDQTNIAITSIDSNSHAPSRNDVSPKPPRVKPEAPTKLPPEAQKTSDNNNINSHTDSANGFSHNIKDKAAETDKETQEWSIPRQPMTTFKPCRKQDSTYDSVPIYISETTTNETFASKLTSSGVFHAQVGQITDQIPGVIDSHLKLIPSTVHHIHESQSSGPHSINPITTMTPPKLNNRQQQAPELPPRRDRLTKLPARPPPPIPPRVLDEHELKTKMTPSHIFNSKPMKIPEGKFTQTINAKEMEQESQDEAQILEANNSSVKDNGFAQSSTEYHGSTKSEIMTEMNNIPMQLNYLLKDQINSDSPKIECVHFGLV